MNESAARIDLDEVDSTNNYLKEHAEEFPDGTVVTARHQTAGRGRLGKQWQDKQGESLLASWLFQNMPPEQMQLLPLAAGLSVCRAMQELGLESVFLKWPNDVVASLNGDFFKLAGILCESRITAKQSFAVCGIGINLTQSRETFLKRELPFAGSVLSIWGKEYSRELVLEKVSGFLAEYRRLLSENPRKLLEQYEAVCITLGKDVKIESSGECFLAKAVSVSGTGELICQTKDGQKVVRAGEVSVRGLYGYIK